MISLAICVFTIVCTWMVYEKLGLAGWKCLIPFYGVYVLCKRIYKTSLFWLYLIAGIVEIVGSVWLISSTVDGIMGILGLSWISGGFTVAGILIPVILLTAATIALIVYTIIANIKLSQAFGMGGAFAVGLILLQPVFLGILAFDSRNKAVEPETAAQAGMAEGNSSDVVAVQPAQEVKNEVSSAEEKKTEMFTESKPSEGNKICPYCRAEISADAKKCPYCRSELE